MITTHYTKSPNHSPGFASLLTVTSVGIGLLLVLVAMYENTLEAQAVQKNSMLRNDYHQREDAFLRALTNILPNKAMICMQDDSRNWTTRRPLLWSSIIDEALVQSNSRQALAPEFARELGLDSMRSGNGTDSNLIGSTAVTPLSRVSYNGTTYSNAVTPGSNITASTEFPPPLECTSYEHLLDSYYPIISYNKKYGQSASGWVKAPVSDFPQYNMIEAPKMHFNYQDAGTMIAKHNWWAFELSFASQDSSLTKLKSRSKKYLISLYEIPSQLPISASTFTTFGAHDDGTEWSNVSLKGSIFAEKVKTEGSFSTDAIAARKGVELSSNTTVNGNTTTSNTGSNPFASNARELSQSKGNIFPISSASDGGLVTFVPINRGLEFYDRFHGSGNSSSSLNAVSPTSWDYYSIGAKQCRMRLDVSRVASSTDHTPTEIEFSYWKDIPDDGVGGFMVKETFTKGENWPDLGSPGGSSFPFHVDNSYSGRPCVAIYVEALAAWLQNKNAGFFEVNNSISVNVDYVNNPSIEKPPFPSTGGDMAVMLMDAKDLRVFSDGFSLVTNMRLIIADDVNIIATTPPPGMSLPSGEEFYPPLSFFAPEKRYGDSGIALKINIDGQLGSLAKGNVEPVRIVDLKSGVADQVVPENVRAKLKAIDHPAALPPINMMNWMVVIREIHPKYSPEKN